MARVIRDPDTGRFVSVDDDDRGAVDRDATEVFSGALSYLIPAADLTSGVDTVDFVDEDSIMVDFTPYLDSDEVFVAHGVGLEVQLSAGATATAEHVYEASYVLRRNLNTFGTISESSSNSTGIINFAQEDTDEDDIMVNGVLAGSGDIADTGTSIGAGGNLNRASHFLNYPEMMLPGPAFDQDDEVALPVKLSIDGSDDQQFKLHAAVTLYGVTYDV